MNGTVHLENDTGTRSQCVLNGTVHLENNTGIRGQYVSETNAPHYHGIVLLQLWDADIGCSNEYVGQ